MNGDGKMETYYLIDFENVHNEGLANVASLSKESHIHIFYTKNAPNISMDLVFRKEVDIQGHMVPVRKQSLDMHLVSYLGYLLGTCGKQNSYVIVSKDTDYDNIIKFWKDKGYANISRKHAIPNMSSWQKNAGMNQKFSGKDRRELNIFMQRGLSRLGYLSEDVNTICKYVVAHCNDKEKLKGIHNDLRKEFTDYREVYKDVKTVLREFDLLE